MQDELADPEVIAIATAAIVRDIPRPEPSVPASAAGLARLRAQGLTILADHLSKTGVGGILKGRVILASPDLLDPFLAGLNLVAADDVSLTVAYSAFGSVTVKTVAGHEMLIEPVMSTVMIFDGFPDEPLFLQMEIAGTVASVIDHARGPDQWVDLDGKNLFEATRRRLGPLKHGQVYALPLDPEDPERFSSARATIADLNEYLAAVAARRPFEVSRVPYIEGAGQE
ncbi:MAG: hypothetical protein MUE52_14350 [Tabrizicola sp.]|jgi:hypothetical protein|nr:hypothetical protein [Tabrizicola sp.]